MTRTAFGYRHDRVQVADGLVPFPDLAGERVMVTGGAGFIGSHLVARLVAGGADVTVLDDFSTGRLDNLAGAFDAGLDTRAVWGCDVRGGDAASLVRSWQPGVLVHLAAQVSVPRAVRMPAWDADVNIRGTINLLDAAADAGVRRVVFASSSAIYGRVPSGRLPVSEDEPLAPGSPYGLSKAAGVEYLAWFRRHRRLDSVALVLGNVYGPGQSGRDSGAVARFAADLSAGRQPVVFGDGKQTRDFVHVSDVADAIMRACRSQVSGLLNVASGVETSVLDVLHLVAGAVGVPVRPRHAEPVAGEPRRMALSIGRARALLGWGPAVGLDDGIRHVVRTAREAVAR